jgi:HPt (histidine-containing phosphotransfer) domain-containing protein
LIQDKKSYNEQQEYCQNVQLQPDTQLVQLSIFKLDSYIDNQGSVDLAFFMLDVYIDENKKFVKALNDAFEHNDTMDIEHNMYGLAKNAKILASNQLTQLCKQWQLVELNQPSAVKEESQRQLLSDITQTALSLEKAAAIIT